MERWLKVLLGTLFGSFGSFIFFLIFDRLVQHVRKTRRKTEEASSNSNTSIPMRVRLVNGDAKQTNLEEMEKLVYEEFDTIPGETPRHHCRSCWKGLH